MKFIHERAVIEGAVSLGKNVSVWACAVIRGDEGGIKIGDNTSVQEHVAIHGKNVEIGDNVTLGHSAVIHGVRVRSNSIVGIGAILLDESEVGSWSIVAAGSVVPPKTKIPEESIVMGIPARVVRKTNDKDKDLIKKSYLAYLKKLQK